MPRRRSGGKILGFFGFFAFFSLFLKFFSFFCLHFPSFFYKILGFTLKTGCYSYRFPRLVYGIFKLAGRDRWVVFLRFEGCSVAEPTLAKSLRDGGRTRASYGNGARFDLLL